MAQAATDEFAQYEVKAPPATPSEDEFSQYDVSKPATSTIEPPPGTPGVSRPKLDMPEGSGVGASLVNAGARLIYGDAQRPNGMTVPGNINLTGRPVVNNPDGSVSTELSFSRGDDPKHPGKEVLVPQVVNGKVLSQDEAWKHYLESGEHLGIFNTPEDADAYAEKVHNRDYQAGGGPVHVYDEEAEKNPSFLGNPKAFLQKRIGELQGESQNQMNQAVGPEAKGSTLERAGHSLMSLAPETAAVLDKVALGLMDWKTAAAMVVSKISPAAAAAYFATQGIQQATSAAGNEKDRFSPDNVQNFLMGLSTAAAAGGAGAEASASKAAAKSVKAGQSTSGPVGTLQRTAQGILDIGPETTERAVSKATADYADEVAATKAKQEAATEKTATKNKAAIEKYESAKTDVARQNEQAKMEHAADTQAVMDRNAAAEETATRRGDLARSIKTGSQQLGEGVAALDKQVRAQGNQKYAAVRAKVANDPGEMPNEVIDAVKHAQKNIIKGTEESTREFNSILRKEVPPEDTAAIDAARGSEDPVVQKFVKKYDSLGDMADTDVTEAEPVDFSDWQGYSSELGKRLAAGNLPGDVYQAVKYVKKAIDNVKGGIAERNGAGDLLDAADAHWRQYMETFYDKPGAVANVLDRVGKLDPDYYAEPFITGKSAGLGQAALRKYSPQLADLAKNLKDQHTEFKSIKASDMAKAPLPEPPAPIENPTKPVLEAAKQIPNPDAPVVDPRQVKTVELQKIAQSLRGFRRYDAFILANSVVWSFLGGGLKALLAEPAVMGLKMAMGKALSRPAVVEWLTRPTPEDMAALRNLPKPEQAHVADNLKGFVDAERKNGNQVDVAPAVQKFADWPEAYRNAPATLSKSGQGGANYSADDLAKFKAKNGIKEEGGAADLKAKGEYIRERDEPKTSLERRMKNLSLEDWERMKELEGIQERRQVEKKRMEKEGEKE